MANMQKTIGFWWKACDHSSTVAIEANVLGDNGANKIKILVVPGVGATRLHLTAYHIV